MLDEPSRFVGFRLNRARSSDWASPLRNWGIPSFALQTHTQVWRLSNVIIPIFLQHNTTHMHVKIGIIKQWKCKLRTQH